MLSASDASDLPMLRRSDGSMQRSSAQIFIIEDDLAMSECLARICRPATPLLFRDVVTAVATFAEVLPDLIILDVLVNGPDAFTLLNEMISYTDTATIPVIIVTSLKLRANNLRSYGVRAIFDKATMHPNDLRFAIQRLLAERREVSHAT